MIILVLHYIFPLPPLPPRNINLLQDDSVKGEVYFPGRISYSPFDSSEMW